MLSTVGKLIRNHIASFMVEEVGCLFLGRNMGLSSILTFLYGVLEAVIHYMESKYRIGI